jgi:hypothetical protein
VSFDTRLVFAAALLRKRNAVNGINKRSSS